MSQSTVRPPPESDEAAHIDKKPRLESGAVPISTDVQLDAPRDLMMHGESSTASKGTKADKPKKQKGKKNRKVKHALPEPCSPEDVILKDVEALLGPDVVQKVVEEGKEWDSPFSMRQEVELTVSEISSSGDSLSIAPEPYPPWVVLTPFALPGEKIKARVYYSSRLHSRADLVEVITPNPEFRDMSRVQCKYFGECAGCQYQMLSYDTQLQLKRNVVVKAYKNFSGLDPADVPEILPTTGSPLQYGYRTKITPHFEPPRKKREPVEAGSKPDWLKIGFNKMNTKIVMDIEECPIATPVLNEALGPVRENIVKNINTYKRGVSLLLRESLEIPPPDAAETGAQNAAATTTVEPLSSAVEKKLCVTDHKATVRERVGDKLFEYTAGSFFQNNNSVLVPLTSYVRDAIFANDPKPRPTHLVDAYCGSGLFAITLSPHFETIAGIELSTESIKFAKRNAELNNIPSEKCSFLAGDAANIFSTVQNFPRDKSVLIIDPPRKGSDEKFIDQLIEFGCAAVVYVSCNVHTQARDVGMILRKSREKMGGREYVVESIRGFDLFPQTAHVESVAVLRLVDSKSD